MTFWQPAGLFDVVDKNGDGIVQWADFVVKSTDFVVLSMPEIAGLPFVITGLVMAGRPGRGAVDGRRPAADDRQRHLPRPLLQRHRPARPRSPKRLTITKVLLVVTALISA